MRDGFVRVAAGTPRITLGDAAANAQTIIALMHESAARGAKLMVLPELCITGATLGDLYCQGTVQRGAISALAEIVSASTGVDMLAVVGLPLKTGRRLMNCAAVIGNGKLHGVAVKRADARFAAQGEGATEIELLGSAVPIGDELLFGAADMPEFSVAVRFLGDSRESDATVIACPSAEPRTVAGADWALRTGEWMSISNSAAHIMANAGAGESTTDMVFGGGNHIIERGKLLSSSEPFSTGLIFADIDAAYLMSSGNTEHNNHERLVKFECAPVDIELNRAYHPLPFVPDDERARHDRCEEILTIQARALSARMMHISCATAVFGVSGGLDSTLAMLVIARALKYLELPPERMLAITMPCFGTTSRTKHNALFLTEALGGTLREIDIAPVVTRHLQDIGHPLDVYDAAYENAQARERTQILMDIANMENGLVVGTGDLSELALGWTTYNGDHMSMYSVNGGVPKTLVRYLVRHVAETTPDAALRRCLQDILDTPVSPELLPPEGGLISQRTEELVGPYELHDFFIYHMLRRDASPSKLKRLALIAFAGVYDEQTIEKWLKVFLMRFFQQQFKRNCMPDGPMVGSVSLSPRAGFKMPSDASGNLYTLDHKTFR